MENTRVGFALCGSFCTFSKVMEKLVLSGAQVIPIMSQTAFSTDTRFGASAEWNRRITDICGHEILSTLVDAEPIGPKKLLDILVIAPCTGNTLGKLANGITDTPVTLAAKAHLRNCRPVVIAVSSNDALSASAKNIGQLMNNKNIFFVPMKQDDPQNKPASIVAEFDRIPETLDSALTGLQLQPVYL